MAVNLLATHVGSWTGTNAFRMMPGDEFAVRAASADVAIAAAGNLTTLAYTWEHPDDGLQAGLLAMWATDDTGATIGAIWSDSWHQQPAVMELTGRADRVIELEGTYGGSWGWQIAVDHGTADALRIVMRNVVPADAVPDPSDAGPYEVAVTELAR